jgi:solute:Na+ symporter, SSS family
MLAVLTWVDHAVIAVYLAAMLVLGVHLARRKRTDEEYFLGGRRMPWFAVGISVIASLLSSLTYLSEPGEVWKSGVTHIFGKMLAIPVEVVIVWLFCIPFMMSFRFTSAYEYLEHRFGRGTRTLGVVLFLAMVILWMGFVVLASARALSEVSGVPLPVVIGTIGLVSTVYTMLGGLRAVIWTDVIQVTILIGGGLFTIGYVAWTTGTGLPEWYATARGYLERTEQEALPLFSLDPTVRTTVVTVALNMTVWHICTHLANQMTVQRYFSTSDMRAARKSFLTGSLFGVGLNLLLVVVGLAVLHFYVSQNLPIDRGLSAEEHRDLIFPTFAVSRLPAGVGGAILAALLAAAMSTIDSGINSIATVLTVEHRRRHDSSLRSSETNQHVKMAMSITLGAGLFITLAAYGLTFLPSKWGIVGSMPRTFNAITAPLGGLFLIGMFLPGVKQRAAILATCCGLATSLILGYSEQLQDLLRSLGWITTTYPPISFTWIMPSALTVTLLTAIGFSRLDGPQDRNLDRLTWFTRSRTN